MWYDGLSGKMKGCKMKRYKLKRTVSTIECPWLQDNVNKGSIVYKYFGAT